MFGRFLKNIRDIVYPNNCLICRNRLHSDKPDVFVCPDCWYKIKKNTPPFCHSCGRHMETGTGHTNLCVKCRRVNLNFDRAFSPCLYEGILKELIHQFKYGGKDYLGNTLSKLMIEFIKEYNLNLKLFDFLVPIPLYKGKLREREFNQAQTLGEHLAREFNMELSSSNLLRIRHTKTQVDLADRERWMNVKDSFKVKVADTFKGKNILLIDDVLTTGATCSEAARALKESGAGIVFTLTLAH